MSEVDLVGKVVFAVTDPKLITVDMAELSRMNAERRAKEEAVNAKPVEETWRGELEELDRRLAHAMTEEQAKVWAEKKANEHAANVKGIEGELRHVRSLIETSGLNLCRAYREGREIQPNAKGNIRECNCDGHLFSRKIAALEIELGRAKVLQENSIRVCGAQINQAKELDLLRPRWQELKKLDVKLSTARKAIRGIAGYDINANF